MNRKLIVAISLFSLVLFAGTALAEWSGWGVVSSIQYNRDSYQDGDVFVTLEGVGCSATNDYFRIKNGQTPKEDMDAMVRLLTASKLSGQPARLGFTRSNGTCQVYAVAF